MRREVLASLAKQSQPDARAACRGDGVQARRARVSEVFFGTPGIGNSPVPLFKRALGNRGEPFHTARVRCGFCHITRVFAGRESKELDSKRERAASRLTSMNALPDDILTRLLARVPLRDVGMARQVCKRWGSNFASRAYLVARRDCAEPLWLVMGGYRDIRGVEVISFKGRALDVTLRTAMQPIRLPVGAGHDYFDAGRAVAVSGLGILLLGTFSRDGKSVIAVHPGSGRFELWHLWTELSARWLLSSICALGDSVWANCGKEYDAPHQWAGEGERRGNLYRYDRRGNLLETVATPDPLCHTSYQYVINAMHGKLVFLTRQLAPHHYRLDSYDPETGNWLRGPNLPITVFRLQTAVLAGKLYVIGGFLDVAGRHEQSAAVQVWDGQVWSVGPSLPFGTCVEFAVASADDASILVVSKRQPASGWEPSRPRTALVLRDGTWRTCPCDLDKITEECAITSYCA